ncbi:MAG: CDP-glycerol glycerophosphotransferase family protein [Melioribacteraceae bacterium]|nr:CDP-glycerol glycerophosphotransferase family protein [Melioribacteraceae bacterium]
MRKHNILFIGGSLNQTTMMYEISKYFDGCNCYFSPFYSDGYIEFFRNSGLLEFTVLGGQFKRKTEKFLIEKKLEIDYQGKERNYDLIFTCSDLIVPENIKKSSLILVQEGMTDPENLMYYLVKWLGLPRYLASTSTTGLSDAYDKFCVASEGYRDLFISKGVNPAKIEVTGIPNFDDCKQYLNNKFPFKNYVLVATSDARETFKYENRKKFIFEALELAGNKPLIFKLHPNENSHRAINEIKKYAPAALVFTDGNINEMIANCDVLVTKYSSVVYVGLALGKQVYSYFNLEDLKKMTPIQNGGRSAANIAAVGRNLLEQNREAIYSPNTFYQLSGA